MSIISGASALRALLCACLLVGCGGGGGGASLLGDIDVPAFSLPRTVGFTEQGSNARANVWTLDQTESAGVNKGPGTLTLQFDVKSTGYYAKNPGSHWAVVTRADNHRNAADGNQGVWGAGLACGRLFYGPDPRCLLESWYADKPDDHWLYDKTLGPVLFDDVVYAVTVQSRINDNGTRSLRYAIDGVYDSGFIDDQNTDYDPTLTGLAVGYVSDTPARSGDWTSAMFVIAGAPIEAGHAQAGLAGPASSCCALPGVGVRSEPLQP